MLRRSWQSSSGSRSKRNGRESHGIFSRTRSSTSPRRSTTLACLCRLRTSSRICSSPHRLVSCPYRRVLSNRQICLTEGSQVLYIFKQKPKVGPFSKLCCRHSVRFFLMISARIFFLFFSVGPEESCFEMLGGFKRRRRSKHVRRLIIGFIFTYGYKTMPFSILQMYRSCGTLKLPS